MSSWLECADLSADPSLLLARSLNHIILYQPDEKRWHQFSLKETEDNSGFIDWADCIFADSTTSLVLNKVHPILFLNLDLAWNPKSGKGDAMLLDFLRYLRLSKYHPKTLTRPDFNLWRSPAVCLSFQSLSSFIKRRPEGLVLFAPSVQFEQLPMQFRDGWPASLRIPVAVEAEIIKYVNSTRPVNLSSNHDLGDIIGPYSILKSLEGAQPDARVSPVELEKLLEPQKRKISTDTLHDILWQSEQRKIADDDINPSQGAIVDSLNALQKLSGRILIIDDKVKDWNPLWKTLEGPKTTWQCVTDDELKQFLEEAQSKTGQTIFPLESFQLVILDLRLEKDDKRRRIEEISGYEGLKSLRSLDEAIPILVFTSSQRVGLLRRLRSAGADTVCHKPARFETAPNLLETLVSEIRVLLSPEYQFLQEVYYSLKKKEARFKVAEVPPMRWALAGWMEARQNLRVWITEKDSAAARLSARSVIRTAGLAAEPIEKEFKRAFWKNTYAMALKALRNSASHVGVEAALNTEVAYIVVFLVTKMIDTLRDDYSNIGIFRGRILRTPNKEKLQSFLDLSRVDALTAESILGLLQLGSLAWALGQPGQIQNAPRNVVGYLQNLEQSALQQLATTCHQYRITGDDLNPFTKQPEPYRLRADFADIEPWFTSLAARI
jgi:CheY-like chemotaxis protein